MLKPTTTSAAPAAPVTDVGVVLCDCRGDLAERLDFGAIERALDALPAVAGVTRCASLCEGDACDGAVHGALSGGAGRLVVAGCARDFMLPRLAAAAESCGLAPGLWEAVNLREHCANVHRDTAAATAKAERRLAAAVSRVRCSVPLERTTVRVRRDVVVIGGGLAGVRTALALADGGHPVTLVHDGEQLGGTAGSSPELFAHLGDSPAEAAAALRQRVTEIVERAAACPTVRVMLNARAAQVAGELGNFSVCIEQNGAESRAEAGAVVIATGAPLWERPAAADSAVTDVPGLLARVRAGDVPRRVAFVLDEAGEQGPTAAAQVWSLAERLAREFDADVRVYCRHVRVARTGLDALYRRARRAGVVAIKHDSAVSVASDGAGTRVRCADPVGGVAVCETFDLVVRADCVARDTDAAPAVKGLRPGSAGSPQYDDVWLLPVLTNKPGIFTVGAARADSDPRDADADALAVAAEICELLGTGEIAVLEDAADVDSDKCVLCLTCLRVCPHNAITIDNENECAAVSGLACQRCGICAAECPARAISLPGYTDAQLDADTGDRPVVTVFACENSTIPAADAIGAARREYDARVDLVRVPCAGKVDPRAVLKALEKGAAKVLIVGCHPESCQYLTGSSRAQRRVGALNDTLRRAGIPGDRVAFGGVAAVEPTRFLALVRAACEEQAAPAAD